MATGFGNFARSILDWVSASDHRYREACKMMELDDDILDDIGLTREELMAEIGIRRMRGTKGRLLGRRESIALRGLAGRRMSRSSF